jgi:LysR family transcriptional regulator, transcriptional activator of the cysJI operon
MIDCRSAEACLPRKLEQVENFRLTVFRAVAEEMSFRKASEVLHLSQPAVSQQIRALEEDTGVQLFDRTAGDGHGSQIALTQAGRVLLGYANASAEMLQKAQRELAALNQAVVGELRLGASTTVAQYVLPRILGAFLKQHPEVHLSLISGNTEFIAAAIAEGKIALGIIEGPAMRRGLKLERMTQDEMVLIVSPRHPWAGPRRSLPNTITPAELTKGRLLLRERGSGSRRVVERALKTVGLSLQSLRVLMELDSTEAIISGVEAGLGVGFVSRSALNKVLRLGTVQTVSVEGLKILRNFSFIQVAGIEPSAAVAAFQRFALASAASTGDQADKQSL